MRILPSGAVIARDVSPVYSPFDVEVANLAEVEDALVERRPVRHAAAVYVVRQVVDQLESVPFGWRSTPWANSKSMS
jgi:hypothetical protein